MSQEMVAALVGAVVGSIVAFVASWWLLHRGQKRTRRNLATALLVELRGAEHMLNLFASDVENPTGDFQTTHFERLDEPLLLFDSVAIFRVIDFKNRLHEIRILREKFAAAKSEARRQRLHSKIVFAAEAVGPLKSALERNGGIAPTPDPYFQVNDYREMPQRSFEYGPPAKQLPRA